jgi:hypothetical protein
MVGMTPLAQCLAWAPRHSHDHVCRALNPHHLRKLRKDAAKLHNRGFHVLERLGAAAEIPIGLLQRHLLHLAAAAAAGRAAEERRGAACAVGLRRQQRCALEEALRGGVHRGPREGVILTLS